MRNGGAPPASDRRCPRRGVADAPVDDDGLRWVRQPLERTSAAGLKRSRRLQDLQDLNANRPT